MYSADFHDILFVQFWELLGSAAQRCNGDENVFLQPSIRDIMANYTTIRACTEIARSQRTNYHCLASDISSVSDETRKINI